MGVKNCLKYPALLLGCLIVGHGLVGAFCGGRITYVEILGVQLWPGLKWLGWQGHYGGIDFIGLFSARGRDLMGLAGSMSTWCVAVVAVVLLWIKKWQSWRRTCLAALSIWWVDLFTYTLPSWGFRRSILWGRVYSEPYEAAVALGIPGPLFQTFVVGSSLILAAALAVRLIQTRCDCPGRKTEEKLHRIA